MSEEDDLRAALAWEDWRRNPCGRPTLELGAIPALAERVGTIPSKTVALKTPGEPKPEIRAAALTVLGLCIDADAAFPATISGYFEGLAQMTRGKKPEWIVEVYGDGEPLPVQPEPPRPSYAQEA